jgi:hypothetical protein
MVGEGIAWQEVRDIRLNTVRKRLAGHNLHTVTVRESLEKNPFDGKSSHAIERPQRYALPIDVDFSHLVRRCERYCTASPVSKVHPLGTLG